MDYLYYLFATLIFIAVVLMVEGLYLGWNSTKGPEAERIARRLRVMSAGGHADSTVISITKERLLSSAPLLQRLLLRVPRVGTLDRLLLQSGLSWSVADLLGITVLAFIAVFFASSYFAMPFLLQLALAGGLATVPFIFVLRAKAKRLTRALGSAAQPAFSPDGKTIAFVGHENGDEGSAKNTHLMVIPARGGAPRSLTAALDLLQLEIQQ